MSGRAPKLLWLVITGAVVALTIAGTVNPWSVAVEKLATIGPGPYVPLSYSYHSSTSDNGTRTYRSQIYFVGSQIGRSWSTYRVTQEENVAKVEEIKFGLLYCVMFVVIFVIGAIWNVRRSANR